MKEQGREGDALRLTCPSSNTGGVLPRGTHYLWTSPEGLPLRMGHTDARHTVQSNGGLIIQSLSVVDEGRYVCSLVVGHHATRNSTVYVTIEDCSMGPCLNAGECEDLDGTSGTKLLCRCVDPYKGRYCESKKNLWYLLIPFAGSGLVVLAIIAVVARFTCFTRKQTATETLPVTNLDLAKPNSQNTDLGAQTLCRYNFQFYFTNER